MLDSNKKRENKHKEIVIERKREQKCIFDTVMILHIKAKIDAITLIQKHKSKNSAENV